MNCPACHYPVPENAHVCPLCLKEIPVTKHATIRRSKLAGILLSWISCGLFTPIYLRNNKELKSRFTTYLVSIGLACTVIGIPVAMFMMMRYVVKDIQNIMNEKCVAGDGSRIEWRFV